jgi:cell division septation protein DedD
LAQQDDYYYEIQLTNKQLVFYFLAGATGLILSFLAGVMVGRGVDNSTNAADVPVRPVQEERVVPEESPKPSAKPAEELSYAARLDSEKTDDSLQKAPKASAAAPPSAKPTPRPADREPPTPAPSARASAAAPKPTPKPTAAAAAAAKPTAGAFTIQVGAFKDKETAESVVARLKKKGFAAFVVAPDGSDSLFNVRVGSYAARADAERVQTKLRDEEKFKPFIVKN